MEYWNNGMMEYWVFRFPHHSNIPVFHHSIPKKTPPRSEDETGNYNHTLIRRVSLPKGSNIL